MAETKQYISKIQIPGEEVYNIKDTEAQDKLSSILEQLIIIDCNEGDTN